MEDHQLVQDFSERYPTKDYFKEIAKRSNNKSGAIVSGFLPRTDTTNPDDIIHILEKMVQENPSDTNTKKLISRLKSVSDLTPSLYNEFASNKNSLLN